METRFVADLHLEHANCGRFHDDYVQDWNRFLGRNDKKLCFSTGAEWTELVTEAWNEVVSQQDLTFVIGDVAMGTKTTVVIDRVQALAGKKVLVVGNHDHKYLKDQAFVRLFESVEQAYEFTYEEKREFDYPPAAPSVRVVMNHAPTLCHRDHVRDAIQLYGHVHDTFFYERSFQDICTRSFEERGIPHRAINVGVMLPWMGWAPKTLDELVRSRDYYGTRALPGESYVVPSKSLRERCLRTLTTA